MADDQSQRTFRNTNPQSRATPTASNPTAGNNDPLAELARLIGQNDPFGEFGRGNAQQPAPHIEPAATPGYAARDPYPPQAVAGHGAQRAYVADNPARQPYASAPVGGSEELYQPQGPVPGYERYDDQAAGAYEDVGYDPNMPYAGDDQDYHDFYDDIPPPRRRMGVLAMAAVFALAIVGTAGAFGYRALFGSVGSGPPPVIKADATPSKIVPAKKKDQSAKLINDRVNDGGDKLVSREEQPVNLTKDKPAGVLTEAQSAAGAEAGAMQQPTLGSGVIGPDPRKIHTIIIRPDQPAMADAGAPPQAKVADALPTQPAAGPKPAQPAGHQAPMAKTHEATPPAARPAPKPAPRHIVTHRAAPARHRVATAASDAPLSLTPDAVAPVRTASTRTIGAPTRLVPSSSGQSAAASGGYAVQVSSRRSQADARAALRRMQSRFASVLGGRQVMIRRVDLGAKGVYYRAMVGPFGSSDDASRLCSRLKAAGGSCFVQRI